MSQISKILKYSNAQLQKRLGNELKPNPTLWNSHRELQNPCYTTHRHIQTNLHAVRQQKTTTKNALFQQCVIFKL